MSRILDNQEIELITRYYNLDLSESELNTFLKKIESDPFFKKEMDYYIETLNVTEKLKDGDFDESITPPKINYQNILKKQKILFPYVLVAIVISIILLVIYFGNWGKEKNNEKVYAELENYVFLMSENVARGGSIDTLSASSYVILQDYIKEIKSLDDTNKEDVAIQKLNEFLSSTTDNNSKEMAYWWLVKLHFEKDELEKAKVILRRISQNPLFNSSEKAEFLLKDI